MGASIFCRIRKNAFQGALYAKAASHGGKTVVVAAQNVMPAHQL
jgi:hypothetical protein